LTEIGHRTIEANGIPIHLAEAGSGPVVLLCRGFSGVLVFRGAISWKRSLKPAIALSRPICAAMVRQVSPKRGAGR
jgi:hypothetical protein